MADIGRLIKKWWADLDVTKSYRVHINKVADFLTEKKLSGNRHEGRRLLDNVQKAIMDKYIDFDHFERLFAKAIFKGALVNIMHWGMSQEEFADTSMPLRLKIA